MITRKKDPKKINRRCYRRVCLDGRKGETRLLKRPTISGPEVKATFSKLGILSEAQREKVRTYPVIPPEEPKILFTTGLSNDTVPLGEGWMHYGKLE